MGYLNDLVDIMSDVLIGVDYINGQGVFCLLIVWKSFLERILDEVEEFFGRFALYEGALSLAHEQVCLQSLGRGIEEDCFSAGVHVVHVVEEAWCASSA